MLLATLALWSLSHGALHAADAAAGESAYNARGCIGCHGVGGKQPIADTYPIIGGKPAAFIVTQVNAFRSGERENPMMTPMVAGLSDADVANIAAYLSSQ